MEVFPMNNKRRKKLEIISIEIEQLNNLIQDIYDEEQECLDNMPDNLQGSDRYNKAEECCEHLEECIDLLSEVVDIIDEVMS